MRRAGRWPRLAPWRADREHAETAAALRRSAVPRPAAAVDARVHDLASLLPRAVRIVVCREPPRAGTGGAVFHAREHLDQRFLLCNGDSLFDCNLAALLAAASDDEPAVTGRILLRQLDKPS